MRQLTETLRRVFATPRGRPTYHDPAVQVAAGLETRIAGSAYYWDGQKRGVDPAHPFFVFQYTLEGWGSYAEANAAQKVGPGAAFCTVVPSAHRYFLPPDAPFWTFFWINIRHPYVVRRIAALHKTAGRVLATPPEHRLVSRAVALCEGVWHALFADAWAQEQAVFDFLFEYERFVHRLAHPEPDRERFLEAVRGYALQDLRRPLAVEAIAAAHGMSRSRFSHRFKLATGLAPAQFVKQLRLEEAARRLLHGDEKLHAIAHEAGFADANHLCKVFRRHYHLSPGEFRRQMRAHL